MGCCGKREKETRCPKCGGEAVNGKCAGCGKPTSQCTCPSK